MSEAHVLLNRITAFRRRLEEMPNLLPDGVAADEPAAVRAFAGQVVGSPDRMGQALRRLAGTPVNEGPPALPAKLTVRAHKLLADARQLVDAQRRITADPLLAAGEGGGDNPFAVYHRSTVSLTESALRLVQTFPAEADGQLRMCDGLDALLRVVKERLASLGHAVAVRRRDLDRIDRVATLLAGVCHGRAVALSSFVEIAESVLDEARRGEPVRFLSVDPLGPAEANRPAHARFVAAHALTAAQVMARLVGHDYEWSARPEAPVAACLLMDVGMLRVPAAVVAKPGPLDVGEKRLIEAHPRHGADLIAAAMPESDTLAEAVLAHHERLDGTGYPNGARGAAVPPLARFLAVADVYAGMMADRPHRPAHDPRAALTDALMLAETGLLDRDFAEYLTHLSFHPVGTVVELTDGRRGVVVANHTGRVNLRAAARPVVAVLADAGGTTLARPEYVDLAAAEQGGVVRAVPTAERRALFASTYPDLCW